MAIDPQILLQQQRATSSALRPETRCRRCRARTRDRSGVCKKCQTAAGLPPPSALSTEALLHYLTECTVELERRRDAITERVETAKVHTEGRAA